jgi:hypothetical protein
VSAPLCADPAQEEVVSAPSEEVVSAPIDTDREAREERAVIQWESSLSPEQKAIVLEQAMAEFYRIVAELDQQASSAA